MPESYEEDFASHFGLEAYADGGNERGCSIDYLADLAAEQAEYDAETIATEAEYTHPSGTAIFGVPPYR